MHMYASKVPLLRPLKNKTAFDIKIICSRPKMFRVRMAQCCIRTTSGQSNGWSVLGTLLYFSEQNILIYCSTMLYVYWQSCIVCVLSEHNVTSPTSAQINVVYKMSLYVGQQIYV